MNIISNIFKTKRSDNPINTDITAKQSVEKIEVDIKTPTAENSGILLKKDRHLSDANIKSTHTAEIAITNELQATEISLMNNNKCLQQTADYMLCEKKQQLELDEATSFITELMQQIPDSKKLTCEHADLLHKVAVLIYKDLSNLGSTEDKISEYRSQYFPNQKADAAYKKKIEELLADHQRKNDLKKYILNTFFSKFISHLITDLADERPHGVRSLKGIIKKKISFYASICGYNGGNDFGMVYGITARELNANVLIIFSEKKPTFRFV